MYMNGCMSQFVHPFPPPNSFLLINPEGFRGDWYAWGRMHIEGGSKRRGTQKNSKGTHVGGWGAYKQEGSKISQPSKLLYLFVLI